MKIVITALYVMVVQDVSDTSKELTYVNLNDVVAIKTRDYTKGGDVEFYMREGASDSLGWKPITIKCYNDSDYMNMFNQLQDRLEE